MFHKILKKFRKKLFELVFPTYSRKYMESKQQIVTANRKLAVARGKPLMMLADILSDKLSYYNTNLLVLELLLKDVAPFVKMFPEVAKDKLPTWRALRGRENVEKLKKYYDDHPYSDDDIYELFNYSGPRDFKPFVPASFGKSLILLNDLTSKFYNVVDHMRVTTDVPAVFDRHIHFFGKCCGVGKTTEDADTPASFLQRLLNANPIDGRTYKVVNNSNWQSLRFCFSQMLHPRYVFSSNDIAIVITNQKIMHLQERYNNIFVYDTAGLFDGVEPGTDIFFDGIIRITVDMNWSPKGFSKS
jgi:hypothetical protein